MYKTVIFDLDGTLLNTLTDLANAVNYALREFSFPERTTEEVRRFIGNGVVKLMERSTPEGTNEKMQEECLAVFRKHYLEHMSDNTAAYDGVKALLKHLKEKGIKTAVVSNKLHSAVVGLCDDYFHGLIDEAIGVSNENERKPSPVNVIKAMINSGSNKKTTVYVGDSEVDVLTAHRAGIKCIGVTWGFRDRAELIENSCDFIAENAEEVLRLIL